MTDEDQEALLDAAELRLMSIYERLNNGNYKLSIGSLSGTYNVVMLDQLGDILAILPASAKLVSAEVSTLH